MHYAFQESVHKSNCPSETVSLKQQIASSEYPRKPPVSKASPVDYPLAVQILKATADLSSVEKGPLLVKARVSHVVDVEL